jgi:FixJ family two-component response regulator
MTQAKLIFVVDDDPSAREGLTRLMRTAGYDVQGFASAYIKTFYLLKKSLKNGWRTENNLKMEERIIACFRNTKI